MRTTRRAARGIERGGRFLDGARVSGMRGGVRARVRRGEMRRLACRDDTLGARLDSADRFRRDRVHGAPLTNLGVIPLGRLSSTRTGRRTAHDRDGAPPRSRAPRAPPEHLDQHCAARPRGIHPRHVRRPGEVQGGAARADQATGVRRAGHPTHRQVARGASPHGPPPPQLCTAFSDVSSSTSRTLWRGHRPGARSRASTPPNPRPPTNPHTHDHPQLDLTSHRPHHPPSFPNRLRCRRRWR